MAEFEQFIERHKDLFSLLKILPFIHSFEEVISPDTECEKSVHRSVELRNLGDKFYRAEHYQDALECYSESISYAPIESVELASAFDRRAAAFYQLRKYELCMLDVNRALKLSSERDSKRRLMKLKARCGIRLKEQRISQANILQKNKQLLEGSINPIERNFCHINQTSRDDGDFKIDHPSSHDPIWNTKFDHSFLPNFSSKVKLENNAEWGRHWVATADIAPGEVLAIEKLFTLCTSVKTLLPSPYCARCSIRCEASIPCSTCSLQMYCSERCRQEAYDLYHRTECRIIPWLYLREINDRDPDDVLLCLRIFLTGTKQGSLLTELMDDPRVYESLEAKRNCVNVPYTDDYLSILNLLWQNDDEFPILSNERENKYATVSQIFHALRSAGFPGIAPVSSCKPTQMELFIRFLLYHHASLREQFFTRLNADVLGSQFDSDVGHQEIGRGISSYQTLMNHSCSANSHVIGFRGQQLIFSLRPIKAGEQIFTNYEYDYAMEPRANREEYLENVFKMECRCRACLEDWPVLEDLMERKNVYLTSDQKIIKEIEEMDRWLTSTIVEHTRFFNRYKEDHLRRALEFNQNIRMYVEEPSRTIFLCENFMKNCFEMRSSFYVNLPKREIQRMVKSMIHYYHTSVL